MSVLVGNGKSRATAALAKCGEEIASVKTQHQGFSWPSVNVSQHDLCLTGKGTDHRFDVVGHETRVMLRDCPIMPTHFARFTCSYEDENNCTRHDDIRSVCDRGVARY